MSGNDVYDIIRSVKFEGLGVGDAYAKILDLFEASQAVSSKDLLASEAERESFERGGQVAVSEAGQCEHHWDYYPPAVYCERCMAFHSLPR